uniref:C2H2-type domain-containing protein n=1 Tax=Timema poppense TaxID=170557 RepID=A0A7R9CQZ9_TIMPO|nr:unnamed protein product [Timema poppensis]
MTHIGLKPFQCGLCEAFFTSKEGLKKHIKRHSGVRPYKCHQCDKAYIQQHAMLVLFLLVRACPADSATIVTLLQHDKLYHSPSQPQSTRLQKTRATLRDAIHIQLSQSSRLAAGHVGTPCPPPFFKQVNFAEHELCAR